MSNEPEWFCNECSTYFTGSMTCPFCGAQVDERVGVAIAKGDES